MDSYTITIAPNDDSGTATRLVVDTSGEQVRITDVHLHAPHGLSTGHIPTVDFGLLLQAVAGTGTASPGQSADDAPVLSGPQHRTAALESAATTEPAEPPAAPAAPKSRARKATSRAAATPARRPAPARTAAPASEDEVAEPRRRRSTRAAATSTTRSAERAPAKATRKAATAPTLPTPPRKRAATRAAGPAKSQVPAKRAGKANPAASATSGAVYRRTPDDLAAVLEQVETVAGIAAHYEVPRHTAQGWVRRLRATA